MKNKIELKTSLPKTIYTDIVGLADPMLLGVTIRYYNYSDETLYMQIVGGGTYWNNHTVNLGSLGSGNNTYANLDNFLSRAVPAAATNETINLTLNGYSDSEYTDLVYTFSRSVTVVFIKSNDNSWTTDFADNFDNASVMGWGCTRVDGIDDSYMNAIATSTSYVTSPSYSLLSRERGSLVAHSLHLVTGSYIQNIYKSFALPNKSIIYVMFNIRLSTCCLVGTGGYGQPPACAITRLRTFVNDTIQITQLGYAVTSSSVDEIPRNRWIRVVLPLATYKNTTIKIAIESAIYYTDGQPWSGIGPDPDLNVIYMDDFKIISK
jgi:hypothetical protein